MRLGTVLSLLGWLSIFLALILLVPAGLSLWLGDGAWPAFVKASLIGLFLGAVPVLLFRPEEELRNREGFLVVALSWVYAAAIGAIPFVLSGAVPRPLDAYFEAMSGFTTTGSTILERVEAVPPSVLFWRALTHWLGGMGIIVLSIAILPVLGIGGMQLYQAEMPGPTKDRLAPRIQDTARILWGVYCLFTAVEALLLILAGMGPFDAVCHAFATMATGGFSTRTASVGAFGSGWIDLIVIVFMAIAGINFTLHWRLLTGRVGKVIASEELRAYLWVGLGATFFVTALNLGRGVYEGLVESLRYSAFQVWSILTTTGFGTADFDAWPQAGRAGLLFLMFLGGMAGSTGGGIKHVRAVILVKFAGLELRRLIHPRAVGTMKLDGRPVPQEVVQSVLGYFGLYLLVLAGATLLVTAQGVDILTGGSAVVATLNNIGPGLAGVGPSKNFASLPDLAKAVLVFCMVAGRLELYTVLLLFIPSYWKGAKAPEPRWRSRR